MLLLRGWTFLPLCVLVVFWVTSNPGTARVTEEIIEKVEQSEHHEPHREKRAVLTVLASIASIASAIFGGGSFTYGIVNGQQRLAELREIKTILDDLVGKVDGLQVGQSWLEGVCLYGDDESRLRYMIDYLTNHLDLDDTTGTLMPVNRSLEWADNILDLGPHGAGQVLHSMHELVMGRSGIFGANSLADVYMQRLDPKSPTYWLDIKNFVEYIVSLQAGGYAAWMTALNIKGLTAHSSEILELGGQRLEEQSQKLLPLVTVLGRGRYMIHSQWGCPHQYMCNAELSWDNTNGPHPMASVEHNDPVQWEIIPNGHRLYSIRSAWGCPSHSMCNAELSWDTDDPHPMASVEFGDPVLWEISPRGSGYVIRSKWGCPSDTYCNAELSWDWHGDNHGRASVEHGDPLTWDIHPV